MISTFGPRLNSVFRSRWRALWWSAGVLLTAYCSVPAMTHKDAGQGAGQDAAGKTSARASDQDDAKAAAEVARLLGDDTGAKPTDSANPWARSEPKTVVIQGQ
ncbi:hypothetical protein MTR62_13440 [Novosphingobium sp. 1949]|uniref:Uncharacterized protein n=1 Tax=Novosphingobium organovorum TaxID=2930092 RepID=A0ABT0BF70_9SPHN|nr:hypothetical protein [Novosphingobium organovorum]MCJ2183686.1 hypothetical protein [Novosphingobium organovorum]